MITYISALKSFFKPVSIKQKLMAIIMAVSLIGLGTVGASILINEFINLNKMQKVDLQVLADIVAETTSGYLLFKDNAGAFISLSAIRSKTQIVRAILYDKNQQVFVAYLRDSGDSGISYDQLKKESASSNTFYVVKEIAIDNELVGYLYLESDDTLIKGFVIDSIIGMVFILVLGSLIAYFLALKLQNIISKPIEHLTKTALKITQKQNYSLRAEKESDDEIGILTDEFNKMLRKLEKRNTKLIESENKFREVVEQSKDALYIIGEKGEFVDVNDAACKALGYKRSELLKMGVPDVDGVYNDKVEMANLLKRLSKEKHIIVESVHFRKNKESYPVEISLGYVSFEKRQLILASVRDITERKLVQESLRQTNELLEVKVNERTRELNTINKALVNAKKKAEAASDAKSLFLANMSHEIRTPMNAVIGFTDLLSSSNLSGQQAEYVKSIQSGSRNLLSLINDILDLSRIEAGKIKINYDKVYVRYLLKDIYQVFSVSAREKGLLLNLNIDDAVPEVINSDEVRLRQILFNLLNNAIKFTRKGEINISAEYKKVPGNDLGFTMILKIKDTGIGVPKSDQKNIFKIFEQQDNQNTREFGGAGLGLAISTRLADKLGAEISLDSEVGKGSTFSLLLHNPEIAEDNTLMSEPSLSGDVLFKSAKILVVDDVELNRELICEYLANQPLNLIVANDGEQAIDLVNSEKPDLVLMDIRMPNMNGIEATEIIKQSPESANMPVIALTASVVDCGKADDKRSLFDMVLNKPLNKKTLISALTKFIETDNAEDKNENQAIYTDMYRDEIKRANSYIVKDLFKYRQPLEKAKNRGSFSGLDKLLEELHEVAVKSEMKGLDNMLEKLKDANQMFDVEEAQKIISKILAGINELEEASSNKS